MFQIKLFASYRYFLVSSEVGLSDQVEIETIPDAVPKLVFTNVNCLNDVDENLIFIDLEITGFSKKHN